MGYCGLLWGTAGYCCVLMGTGRYLVVLGAVGGTRGNGGTDRHCGDTTEYWVVLEVLVSNRGTLWGTVGYCRVLLGSTGCCGVVGGRILMGNWPLGYFKVPQCTWMHCRVHGTAVPCNLRYPLVPCIPQCPCTLQCSTL